MGTLRFLLALVVAYGHFAVPLSFPTSDIAVQSFFVISGFYMALVLNEKYGPGSYWLFISNRLLRLWPAYFVVLILSLAAANNWKPIAALDWFDIAFFTASQILIVGPGDLSDSVCQQRHTGFYGPLHRGECAALQFRSRPAGLVPRVGNLLLFAGAVSRETRTDVYRSDDRREPFC